MPSTITATIKTKRGTKSTIPTLTQGEQGFCTDTMETFIGHADGNKRLSFPVYLAENFLDMDGVNDDYAALNSLLTLIGSDKAKIVINKTLTLLTNITIPSNITLNVIEGGLIDVGIGKALTGANAKIEAGLYQIFDVSAGGSVNGIWDVEYMKPEWYGANNPSDIVSAFTTEMNKAQTNGLMPINKYRKFKPQLCASPQWLTYEGAAVSESYILNDVKRLKSLGVDSLIFCCHVDIDGDGDLYIIEEPRFDYAYATALSYGLSINAIKFHCTFDDVVDVYVGDFETDYKALVVSMCVKAEGKAKYFTVLNEIEDVYFAPAYEAFVIDLLTTVKTYDFLVGVSLTWTDLRDLFLHEYLITNSDVIFSNFYVPISFDAERVTLEQSLQAWDNLDLIKYYKDNYDLPIIISESGVHGNWECLSNPAQWDWTGITQTDSLGGASYFYLYGMLNSLPVNQIVDEVWLWFTNYMHYEKVYRLVNEFTGGVSHDE
jgi:hypothetical protein